MSSGSNGQAGDSKWQQAGYRTPLPKGKLEHKVYGKASGNTQYTKRTDMAGKYADRKPREPKK